MIVGTPGHWHALAAVLACQAGKDVYVEKPLATSIQEGRAMITSARKCGRIVQVGTQQKVPWPLSMKKTPRTRFLA